MLWSQSLCHDTKQTPTDRFLFLKGPRDVRIARSDMNDQPSTRRHSVASFCGASCTRLSGDLCRIGPFLIPPYSGQGQI